MERGSLSLLRWLRQRKTAASVTTLAVLIAGPVTLALLHQGFPVSAVDLQAKDVWVTNGQKLLTGRLNMQIAELNGGVAMASRNFDVMQAGPEVLVYDEDNSSVERVDPAFVSLGQKIAVPPTSEITYGGSVMTILRPTDGALWIVPTAGELQFDPETTQPAQVLGKNAHAVATLDGRVFAVSAEDGALYQFDGPGSIGQQKATVVVANYALSAVGDHPVILDRASNTIIKEDGSSIALPEAALRIQQVGADRDFVVVATGDSLLKVSFGGSVQTLSADASTSASDPADVAAPVVLGACIHGAWTASAKYLGVCNGGQPKSVDIPSSTSGSRLEFRVNRNVIALNNLTNGNVWLVTDSMRLVENWDEVTPPQDAEGEATDEKSTKASFEDTLAERTDQNTPPIARPDDLGVRPGRTTILDVVENDTDPDGDVLTITGASPVSESAGKLQFIDGSRSLQFTPAPDASGTVSFRYTISDGRPGGVAESQVNITIRPTGENLPPIANRLSGVAVEAGQTVSYNVLTDWIDPDGDDLQLTGAASTSGDTVRFRPDGEITFSHTTAERGQKVVQFTVFDGKESVAGEVIVDVKTAGELNPVGVPDFVTAFAGQPAIVSPLDNDRSPSGALLVLAQVEPLDQGIGAVLNADAGTVAVTSGQAGVYYLKYALTAGMNSSIGLIRVDVVDNPADPLPPVAVKDTAYVRPNEPTSLAALANDQSPGGPVIGIQSVDLPVGFEQFSVEVLNSSVLRITAPSGMTEPKTFTYTISDGLSSSTAGVTIVPVPELIKHQAPIATDDVIKVRAGDVATVSVLDNDYHPDGARMILDNELVQASVGTDGLAFVTGNQVRLQAPTEPGQYSVTYRIHDAFDESAVASVVFTVLPTDAANNQAPLPKPLTARVFQEGTVTIDVPLNGVDPDGDSVVLTSVSGAESGEIKGTSTTAFTYAAYADSAGTDSFTYQVEDSLGQVSTGEVRIGVIPRGDSILPPSAVGDEITIRPGRVASVPVLGNDSDSNGFPIELLPDLLAVDDGITATVDKQVVVVTAGDVEGTFSFRYQITNAHSVPDDAFVKVVIDKNAAPQPPVAEDQVVEVKDIVGARTVDVNVLDRAQNPSGLIGDLAVSLDGANAAQGEALADGIVRVTLGDSRQAIAYRLANQIDDLSAMAFIVVPPYTPDLPPVLKPELVANPPAIPMNQTKEWKISDLLDVPSGRPVRLINTDTVSAGRGNGDPIAADDFTLKFTPEADFRGETSISFEVADGDSIDDASGNRAVINFRFVVGDPNFEDVVPTFSTSTIQIEAGEAPTVFDLLGAAAHPNPDVLSQLQFRDLTGSTAAISASLAGSNLTISAPFGTQPGQTTTLDFTMSYKSFTVPASVDIVVVASTRPLAQPTDDVVEDASPSTTYPVSPLTNDFNPFASDGVALRIVDAVLETSTAGTTVAHTATGVTVRTGTAKSGTIAVIYTVRDATDTAAREVQGRITINVISAPDAVTVITLTGGPQSVSVAFGETPASNGATPVNYDVTISGAPGTVVQACAPGSPCQFTGRTNGQLQTVTVTAINRAGSTISGSSSITPYGTPAPPGSATASNGPAGAGYVNLSWGATPDIGGGSPDYQWRQLPGGGWNSVGGAQSASPNIGVGNSASFEVRVCNSGGLCSTAATSNAATAPVPPPTIALSRGGSKSGTTTAWLFHLEVRNFAPNSAYQTICYSGGVELGGGSARPIVNLDGSGSFSGDIQCWDGFGNNDYVVINGVTSNTANWGIQSHP